MLTGAEASAWVLHNPESHESYILPLDAANFMYQLLLSYYLMKHLQWRDLEAAMWRDENGDQECD